VLSALSASWGFSGPRRNSSQHGPNCNNALCHFRRRCASSLSFLRQRELDLTCCYEDSFRQYCLLQAREWHRSLLCTSMVTTQWAHQNGQIAHPNPPSSTSSCHLFSVSNVSKPSSKTRHVFGSFLNRGSKRALLHRHPAKVQGMLPSQDSRSPFMGCQSPGLVRRWQERQRVRTVEDVKVLRARFG
jgi:hypothetical protein